MKDEIAEDAYILALKTPPMRSAGYRRRMIGKGLVRVSVWVPKEDREELRRWAAERCEQLCGEEDA